MNPEDEKFRILFTEEWNKGTSYRSIAKKLDIPFNKAITLRLTFKELKPRWKTRYRIAGKQKHPINDEDFSKIMTTGNFVKKEHKGYAVGLYYTAVRREELNKATKEQFTIKSDVLSFNVEKRLKHGINTNELDIPMNADYLNYLIDAINKTPPGKKVFGYSGKTCYNIMRRAGFFYPHFMRLSRITNFFLDGWTVVDVHSWTGLTLRALDFYLGIVSTSKMGKSLVKNQKKKAEEP